MDASLDSMQVFNQIASKLLSTSSGALCDFWGNPKVRSTSDNTTVRHVDVAESAFPTNPRRNCSSVDYSVVSEQHQLPPPSSVYGRSEVDAGNWQCLESGPPLGLFNDVSQPYADISDPE